MRPVIPRRLHTISRLQRVLPCSGGYFGGILPVGGSPAVCPHRAPRASRRERPSSWRASVPCRPQLVDAPPRGRLHTMSSIPATAPTPSSLADRTDAPPSRGIRSLSPQGTDNMLPSGRPKRHTILVVDDEPDVVKSVKD